MEKIILSTAALSVLVGLNVTDGDNVTSISNAIVALNAKVTDAENKKTAAELKVTEMQTKLDAQLNVQATALIDGAIAEGKLTAGEKEAWLADAKANYELTARAIAKIPGKTSLANQVNNSEAGAGEVKNIDAFEKLTPQAKLAFKNDHPEEYKQLFASNG